MRNAAFAAVAGLLWGVPATAAIDIPVNRWVKQPSPQVVLLPGFPGTFGPRAKPFCAGAELPGECPVGGGG